MSISQPYPAPPIIDAIVELRLKAPLDKREQERVVKAFKPFYDRHQETSEVDVQVKIEEGNIEAQTGPAKAVHILSNDDQNDFCRVEESKLHWSRLPPYEGWACFEDRIFRDLKKMPKKIGIPSLERLGVRYRNRVDVPVDDDGICRYEDYVSVNLQLPTLLDPHDGYQWKIEKHFRDRGISATVMSGIMPSELPKTMAVLLDVDVYVIGDLPKDRDNLSNKLEEMRALKNEIFEACVTDKARASFQ
ncbi:TIGR04255 family protein [Novosphingobium sp. SL115]|uniref:TIGR04255 family protein n=1 Tax=Novosphingobium sp. SL115 TaxID=2995150 RepID=UPI0022740810|nr:TIGR04255 family protein [Novosphingobium sp. SL115]MCY1670169.1 TIGR04255 family protein [Novosphingobium sp. SL115]